MATFINSDTDINNSLGPDSRVSDYPCHDFINNKKQKEIKKMIDKKTESEIQEASLLINVMLECAEIENSNFRNSLIQNTTMEGACLKSTNLCGVDISNIDFTTEEARKMVAQLRKQQNKGEK